MKRIPLQDGNDNLYKTLKKCILKKYTFEALIPIKVKVYMCKKWNNI
jgi:hypothetical protein